MVRHQKAWTMGRTGKMEWQLRKPKIKIQKLPKTVPGKARHKKDMGKTWENTTKEWEQDRKKITQKVWNWNTHGKIDKKNDA